MIKLNGKDYPWEEGLTVEKLLEKKGYTFPMIIVRINDKVIEREDYATTIINDGDNVEALHIFGGG